MKIHLIAALAGSIALSACVPVPVPGREKPVQVTPDTTSAAGRAINAFRTANGLSALGHSDTLQRVAQAHADDMARTGVLSHKGSGGSTPASRAKAAGYRYCSIAENIAEGPRDLATAMKLWEESGPHRANMVKPELSDFAIAQSGVYWVMVLGRPGC
ncbi:CAP domain-containing protein [Mesobacterium sp. TK19101]|uniref:CAP domain-containing protein n=1 Tax=Mesobacterium hydrothermale TaxID=3111907 RepID=A0ABU6HII6_9RHOB|nr:CAP domain-containing protein [Mesobacterium sp. TK19101]MEC3862275.1 CAP domain-containing protein [Mesobacterium sp. TK19101]